MLCILSSTRVIGDTVLPTDHIVAATVPRAGDTRVCSHGAWQVCRLQQRSWRVGSEVGKRDTYHTLKCLRFTMRLARLISALAEHDSEDVWRRSRICATGVTRWPTGQHATNERYGVSPPNGEQRRRCADCGSVDNGKKGKHWQRANQAAGWTAGLKVYIYHVIVSRSRVLCSYYYVR